MHELSNGWGSGKSYYSTVLVDVPFPIIMKAGRAKLTLHPARTPSEETKTLADRFRPSPRTSSS